jgi:hypothetical protein
MVKNGLHAIALNHRLAAGRALFTRRGRAQLQALAWPPHLTQRRDESLELLTAHRPPGWADRRGRGGQRPSAAAHDPPRALPAGDDRPLGAAAGCPATVRRDRPGQRRSAHIVPELNAQSLRIRVHALANPRRNHALAHVCATLNALELQYPGTTLTLVYEALGVA